MPNGIPVATVALNAAKNAGLLAVRMLAMTDPILAAKMEGYQEEMKNEVIRKANRLEGKTP